MIVNPLAEQRSWVSPYNFAQINPINRIDLDGTLDIPLDDYGLDKNGKVELLRITTDDPNDKLIALDDNGAETESLTEVEKGILNNIENTTVMDSDGITQDVQIMETTNSKDNKSLFEFITANSNNEFSYSSWFSNRKYISTSFQAHAENSINVLYPRHKSLLHHVHSHPDPYLAPSPGDISTAGILSERLGYKPRFEIYSPFLGEYKDFDQNSSSFELDEIIITVPKKKN